MEFSDDAIVLGGRGHGETGAIVHVLTNAHGVYAAHIAGGASRRLKAALQPGARVVFTYRARHADQLGSATLEIDGPTPDVLDDPLALIGLQCACTMTRAVLPEREAQPGAFHALGALIGVLDHEAIWPAIYVRYEAGLLEAIGFGLDLTACAVTGERDALVYVSPKSGRAVSRTAGAGYHDKLLRLPAFLQNLCRTINPFHGVAYYEVFIINLESNKASWFGFSQATSGTLRLICDQVRRILGSGPASI